MRCLDGRLVALVAGSGNLFSLNRWAKETCSRFAKRDKVKVRAAWVCSGGCLGASESLYPALGFCTCRKGAGTRHEAVMRGERVLQRVSAVAKCC